MSSHEAGVPVERAVRQLSARRIWIARIIAMAADAVQMGLFPIFGAGAWSVLDDWLDVGVGVLLILLVGWHFAFLPSFVAELIPGVDLIPTWTVAVWIATRNRQIDRPGVNSGAISK